MNSNYIDIPEPIPEAVPVVVKEEIAFSISTRLTELLITLNVITFLTKALIDSLKNLKESFNIGTLIIVICLSCFIIIVLYKPIASIVKKNRTIPVYGYQTISNTGMTSNIISGFSNKDPRSFLERVKYNFTHPSWNLDVIHIYNNIIMTFYQTCQNIYSKLDEINDNMASIDLSVKANRRSILKLEITVEKLEKEVGELRSEVGELRSEVGELRSEVGELRSEVGELRSEMRSGFQEIKTLLSRNIFIVPVDDE